MIIGGLQKFSLLDYPDHLAAIIFTQGCNFRCQFCYNPMLVLPLGESKSKNIISSDADEIVKRGHSQISEDDLFDFLKTRIGKLDAVVITGGEPTIHADLLDFIARISEMGYKIKLDTNGANPEMLRELIKRKLINYLAMDIKTALSRYDLITGAQPDLNKIKESIIIIKEGGLPYEFRTTVVPELVKPHDIKQIGKLIKGAEKWFLQKFKSDIDLVNSRFRGVNSYNDKDIKKMREIGRGYVKKCETR